MMKFFSVLFGFETKIILGKNSARIKTMKVLVSVSTIKENKGFVIPKIPAFSWVNNWVKTIPQMIIARLLPISVLVINCPEWSEKNETSFDAQIPAFLSISILRGFAW